MTAWSIFWDVFWILLIWVPLVLLWAIALFDIFFRNRQSGGAKAGWAVLVVLVPYVGAIIYLLLRPDAASTAPEPGPPATGATPDPTIDALQRASALHDAGKLSDAEFAAIKRTLVEAEPG
jgi:phospholipase D-like protein